MMRHRLNRITATLFVLYAGVFAISYPSSAADLSALRQVGPMRIGPSDFAAMPPEWQNMDTRKPCRCHEICKLYIPRIDLLSVFSAYPPKQACGVQGYALYNDPALKSLSFRPAAIAEFSKTEQDILRDYGPPTYRTTKDDVQLAYCTTMSGRVLTLREAKTTGEMLEYGFRFDPFNRGRVGSVMVRWTRTCQLPPLPSVP
jgi:hypothetical protein